MTAARWQAFPHDGTGFAYDGGALRAAWSRLHAGDCEPFPDAVHADALLLAAGPHAPGGLGAAALAKRLQSAWRAFHRGAFQEAFDHGRALGPVGASVATKALGIHATYLEADATARRDHFAHAARLAEAAVAALPGAGNSHSRHALALGRYGQGLALARAIGENIPGRVRASLEATLATMPRHAEAHLGLALYHAEIVARVGALVARLSYGASARAAEDHLDTARALLPEAPITHIEHGNLLTLLHGDRRRRDARAAYARAVALPPADASEALDIRHARRLLA